MSAVATSQAHAHPASNKITLWMDKPCPFGQRIWIALEELQVPYQWKLAILPDDHTKRPADLLAVNPKGTHPFVQFSETAGVPESNIGVELIQDLAGPGNPGLFPSDPTERALVRLAISNFGQAQTAWFKFGMNSTNKDVEKDKQAFVQSVKSIMDNFKGPWYLGDRFSAVDVTIAPIARRTRYLTRFWGFDETELGQVWLDYRDRILARPSVAATCWDENDLVYLPWYTAMWKIGQ